MTNNDELERQKFESWILTMPFAKQSDVLRLSGVYFHLETQWCWLSWQARAKQESNHD